MTAERHGRIPLRVHDALEAGDLSPGGFLILAFLEGRANHRQRPPAVAYTLRGLSDAVSWPWGPEYLRQTLHQLRDASWLEFDVKKGQRTKYVFSLTGCVVGVQLEVESGNPRSEAGFAIPQTQTPYADTEANEHADAVRAAVAASTNEWEPNGTPDGLSRLVKAIRDSDEKTERTFRKHFGDLRPHAFVTALEALEERRQNGGRSPLVSEAKYVFATLESMKAEGHYS